MNYERPISFDKTASAYWTRYYASQARSGGSLPAFRGELRQGLGLWGENYSAKLQSGDGFFSSLKSFALPIVKYLGMKGADTLIKAGSDALGGENLVNSLKRRGQAAAEAIVDDTAARATKFIKTGKGKTRRRRRRSKRIASKKFPKKAKSAKKKSIRKKHSVKKQSSKRKRRRSKRAPKRYTQKLFF